MGKYNLVPSKKTNVEKVLSTYKKPLAQKQVIRAVSDNKGKIAVVGAVVATVATGVGILGTAVVKKHKERKREKELIEELEAENQQLVSIISSMVNESVKNKKKSPSVVADFESELFTEDDAIKFDEQFQQFTEELADSLEKDGDEILKHYAPNETITYSEEDFLEGVTEAPDFDEDLEEIAGFMVPDVEVGESEKGLAEEVEEDKQTSLIEAREEMLKEMVPAKVKETTKKKKTKK